ncbi:type I-C CRISPR-associated endonuclease Cas1 [Myxococcota bacterium]|jgi:CRISPR-associated protein Cas1|nr:type I-C CRISPR-associated endonuclease Cas1 [Myxococcota bacterium]
MKKLLNTLYVTTQGTYLAKDGECVVVKVNNEVRLRVPIHTLGGVVCFGQVSCSPFLLGFAAERGVNLSFLTEHGRFLARVHGPVAGNVLLRREQYRRADDNGQSAEVARAIVSAKIVNSRRVLQRAVRDHPDKIGMSAVVAEVSHLQNCAKRLKHPAELDVIRGIEGEAANRYFGVFDHLILAAEPEFRFIGRNRRPPLDRVNALLSFLYTLIEHDIRGALEGVGLDPAVGFLHRDRPSRYSLALDLMEEFRAFLGDRLVLSLINLGQVRKKDFEIQETGAVKLSDNARKTVLVTYQNRKQDEMMHPFLEEKVPVGLLFHVQAMLMARWLRGDLDGYPPFMWR